MRHEIGVRNSQLSMISMELVLLHFRRYSLVSEREIIGPETSEDIDIGII
jgi:hypothetical protein